MCAVVPSGEGRRRLAPTSLLGVLLGAVGVLALVVSVAFVGLFLANHQLHAASDRRAGSEAVVASANRAEKLLLDLETGERGFVITDLPGFLEPWRSARSAFPQAVAHLTGLLHGNPTGERLATAIQRAGVAYLTGWSVRLIDAERRDPSAARRLVASGQGKREVDAMRRLFSQLVADQGALASRRTQQADSSSSLASAFAIAGLGGSLIVLAIVAVLLARWTARPLVRLGAATERMAAGDLRARVPVAGPRELAVLADSFNAMAEGLEQGHEELVLVTERAESANRAKSEFLSRMSHELRTPLNAILGFGQLLKLEDVQEPQRDHIDHILKAGGHLLALINEVLELSRIEAGQLSLSPESVPLEETINEALALVEPLGSQRRVSLSADFSGLAGDGHVHADRQRLKQVLLNLLSNAIKYNRLGGRVEIAFILSSEQRTRIVVSDTGVGISPQQLAGAFEPFERLGAEVGEVEGTGLGLALSKRLIEAMGGSIALESEAGRGTTVTLELDSAHPPDARGRSDVEAALAIDKTPRITGEHRRVLYIEDNLSNLTLIERILEREPAVEVVPAMQGRLGLDLAHDYRPELIMLDLHLPDMTGEEVLRRLRSEPDTAGIPVIVLSADASNRRAEKLLQIGAQAYLTKPLDVEKFLEVLVSHFSVRVQAPE